MIASNGVGGQRISGQRTKRLTARNSPRANGKGERTDGQKDGRMDASHFASPHDDVADDRKLCPEDRIRPITLVVVAVVPKLV